MDKNLIFTFGLDRAGKTVISNYFTTGLVMKEVRPTLTVNYSKIILVDIALRYCDAPGQKTLRKIWEKNYKTAYLLIFVLDVADHIRYEESRSELLRVLADPNVADVPLLFLFNKMDLPEAKDNFEFAREFFTLKDLQGREAYYFKTTAEDPATLAAVKTKLIELVKKVVGL
jgi:small GTP-binding protein